MKKAVKFIVAVMVMVLLCTNLTGCWLLLLDYEEDTPPADEGGQTDVDNEAAVSPDSFDEDSVLKQLEVTEYSYSNDFWHYAFLVIKNNSKFTLDISVSVKFFNEAGELIGVQNNSESPVASNSEVCLYFMPDEKFATMEYEVAVEREKYYESVVHDLSFESISAKDKEIISVTNNGSEAAQFVKVYALFFNGDKVVGFDWTYVTDDDNELKPQKTISKELSCYEEYTSVKYFFTGQRLD